jgi:TPP-dependent pyruvate/acetoin dehydrogenase alpha subunit
MAYDLDKLRDAYEKAERHAFDLQVKKDEEVAKVRDRYTDKLRKAVDKAAEAQKALANGEVAASLLDRPDGRSVAESMIRTGGFTQEQVDEMFPPEE